MTKIVTVLSALFVSTLAHADPCASKARAIQLAAMFSEGGSCATLPETSRDAIRNYSPERALETFRTLKRAWLVNFDPMREGSLANELGLLYAATPQWQKIYNLFKAVDQMRPNGGTTLDHVFQVQAALQNVKGLNESIDGLIAQASAGLDTLRMILLCRLDDEELVSRKLEAQRECPNDATPIPARADVFSVFIGPVTELIPRCPRISPYVLEIIDISC